MNIFKINGGINLSKLSKFMGYSPQKLKSARDKVKNSLTVELKEKNQKQYDALVLGGLAMYAKLTKEEIVKMIKKPTVVIMVGLPCSGKSTYIKENLKGFSVVSFDNYIMNRFDKNNYNNAYLKYSALGRTEKKLIFLEIRNQYCEMVIKNENIVVDFTNLDPKEMGRNWLDILPSNYRKSGVMLTPPMELILNRNSNRKDKFIPIDVLNSMKKQFEKSNYQDIFDTLIIIE